MRAAIHPRRPDGIPSILHFSRDVCTVAWNRVRTLINGLQTWFLGGDADIWNYRRHC
jgi:hypothetical protein